MSKVSPSEMIQRQLKEELADKVAVGEKLTASDRQDIYFFLTGKKLKCKKRGRPSKEVRDYHLALNYLTIKDEGKRQPSSIRADLVKQYCLSDNDNTFYIALKRGMEKLRSRSENFMKKIDDNDALDLLDEDKQELKSTALYRLKLLDDYKIQNEHLKK